MFGFVIGALCLVGLAKMWGPHGWARHGYRHGGHRRWMMRRLFERLDTTPGQEKVMAQAVEDVEHAMWKARDTFMRSRSGLAGSLRGEQFDNAAVDAAFEGQQASVDDVKKVIKESMQKVHEALRPEQRAQLSDLLEFGPRAMHGWHGGHSHHGHRHGVGGPASVHL